MIKIECRTRFDITATGVTGHFKSSRIPFTDRAGHRIVDADSWNRVRNQQRNWETLTQLINLRTQIMSMTDPVKVDNTWIFEFESESNVWDDGADSIGVLWQDCAGVPMLRELDNDPDIDDILIADGTRQNIWFNIIPINNVLEN